MKNIETLLTKVEETVVSFLQFEWEAREKYCQFIEETSREEIARLNAENSRLEQLLAEERTVADTARDELILDVSRLLAIFCDARSNSFRRVIEEVKQKNAEVAVQMKAIEHESEIVENSTKTREKSWYSTFEETVIEGKTMMENRRQVS